MILLITKLEIFCVEGKYIIHMYLIHSCDLIIIVMRCMAKGCELTLGNLTVMAMNMDKLAKSCLNKINYINLTLVFHVCNGDEYETTCKEVFK